MSTKLDKFIKFIPKEMKPDVNPMLNALLKAWANADDELMVQLKNTKAQLFVKTAEGVYLDRLASDYGVSRPMALGLLDEDFQQLIPNLSLKQKQISKSFYDTMDVFWGPTFSRANITPNSVEPFNVSIGDTFTLSVDSGASQSVTIAHGDIRVNGGATAKELQQFFSKFSNLVVEVITDVTTGDKSLNFRTNTPGLRGSIEFISGFGAFTGITQGFKYRITSSPQRTVLYQVNPGEIIIELPAIVPTLRRTLKGSHHFHTDSTIEPPIAPSNGIWQGSFIYSTTENPFVVTGNKSTLLQPILKGSVINQITVADSSVFPVTGGNLIFDFGKDSEEQPVSYITVPNTNTILIDPGYSFQNYHMVGASVNLLKPGQVTIYKPRVGGQDLAIYLTSPANARSLVQDLLKTLTAAGITVKFLILLPEYIYLKDNPYSIDNTLTINGV